MLSKVCGTCFTEKAATEFWRQKTNHDGLFGECKACGRRRNQQWHREHPEEARARNMAATRAKRQRHPMAGILASAKHRAAAAGMEFSITLADVPVPERCPVLGIALKSQMGTGWRKGQKDASPSIDRIDNGRGYTPDNVIVVSLRANRIKSDSTPEELTAVADFYRRLANDRRGEGSGRGPLAQVERLPTALPEMLASAAEEEGPLSSCDDHARGRAGVLPSLQLGDDFQR